MDVRSLVVARNSEEEFATDFISLVNAGCSIIHVRTNEVGRCLESLRKLVLMEGDDYTEWDVINGNRTFGLENFEDPRKAGDGDVVLPSALEKIWNKFTSFYTKAEAGHEIDTMKNDYTAIINPQFFWDRNPTIMQRFIDFSSHLAASNIFVVLVTPDIPLPDDLSHFVNTIEFKRPGHAELSAKASAVFTDLEDQEALAEGVVEQVDQIALSGMGMTRAEFETAVSKAVVTQCAQSEDSLATAESLITSVRMSKTEIIKKNDLLELMQSQQMSSVGGMEHLKAWVRLRANCYSDEAREFGIEPPKGIVLVGVPGTGKSLAAKAVSSEFGIPLVRLDFSKVFNSLVGSSEQRMRTALSMVEAMAPCVCFADEIDKGLGGIANGGGDAGTSMRVLGTFLTWLQESPAPVFTIVTANNVNGLPPELLRRGRFDAIFSTTLPTIHERRDVLEIHMEKRGWDIDDFDQAEIAAYLEATDGYVPAEIEATVKDGLVLGFNSKDKTLTVDNLLVAARNMVPLSKSHANAIAGMVKWSAENATPASYTLAQRAEADRNATGTTRQSRKSGSSSTGGSNVRRIETSRSRRRRNSDDKDA